MIIMSIPDADAEKKQLNDEVHRILEKLEGIELPHVRQPTELRAAVERAIRTIGISSKTPVRTIVEIIDTDEGQLDVHSAPSN